MSEVLDVLRKVIQEAADGKRDELFSVPGGVAEIRQKIVGLAADFNLPTTSASIAELVGRLQVAEAVVGQVETGLTTALQGLGIVEDGLGEMGVPKNKFDELVLAAIAGLASEPVEPEKQKLFWGAELAERHGVTATRVNKLARSLAGSGVIKEGVHFVETGGGRIAMTGKFEDDVLGPLIESFGRDSKWLTRRVAEAMFPPPAPEEVKPRVLSGPDHRYVLGAKLERCLDALKAGLGDEVLSIALVELIKADTEKLAAQLPDISQERAIKVRKEVAAVVENMKTRDLRAFNPLLIYPQVEGAVEVAKAARRQEKLSILDRLAARIEGSAAAEVVVDENYLVQKFEKSI